MNKKYLYITRGISCSGKTTWATNKVKEDFEIHNVNTVDINRDYIRFNHVSPGSNWRTYKMNKTNENLVTGYAQGYADLAVLNGSNIIISDTNLNPTYLKPWINFAYKNNYEIKYVDFTVSVEEAWKRDTLRPNGVGHSIIYQQAKRISKKYKPNSKLPSAIIVDIDGTVADKGDRSPFNWMAVDGDTPRSVIITMVKAVAKEHNATILFTSGRDSVCRDLTLEWIEKHIGIDKKDINLFMRPEKDMRKDTEVKEEIFWKNLEPNYNIIGAFDDRPCIVRLWNLLELPNVVAVADPYVEF